MNSKKTWRTSWTGSYEGSVGAMGVVRDIL
jgi:hypothetical protein